MPILRVSPLFWFSLTASICTIAVAACGGSTTSNSGFAADSGTGSSDTDGGTDTDTDGAAPIPVSTAVAAVPLSFCIPSSYTLAATVGDETFDITIDTGSTTLGVAASTCTTCKVSPEYTPSSSATDEGEQAESQYESGSWTGEIYSDSVTIDKQTAVPVKLVAIQTQSQFFNPQECGNSSGGIQGIIGLAPAGDELSGTNGYFDRFVATTKSPNVFATQLCDNGGTLWLGGYDSTFTTAAPQYTPMLADFVAETYAVNLVSITVNGGTTATAKVATADFPDSIVDTGTSIFILPTAAYNTITKAIGADPSFSKLFGSASYFSNPENCKTTTQSKAELDAMLPSLTLTFGTTSPIQVQATATESYLAYYQGIGWCPALDAQDPSNDFPASSIMGAPVLRSNVIIFDRVNKQVGFAPHTPCPTK